MSEKFEIIEDIPYEFPVIQGASDRQIWYARNLRHIFVLTHEERFRDIGEAIYRENDRRITSNDWYDDESATMEYEFTEAEKACLFGEVAAGIIATLKEAMGR